MQPFSGPGSRTTGSRHSIRVVVIDDDRVMRSVISAALESDPDIEVVGKAANATEGRNAIRALDPDVVTLDIMLPDIDGLTFLSDIMQSHPMPVVMISGLTGEGTDETIRALEAGAVEWFEKPSPGSTQSFPDLPEVIKAAAAARIRARKPAREPVRPVRALPSYEDGGRVVAIGSSTGGVEALLEILSAFPANCPPTVVVQHMPAGFTKSFAERLDRRMAPKVLEAFEGAPLEQGVVYIAPGGIAHLEIVSSGGLRCHLRPDNGLNRHKPSVSVLFNSLSIAAPRNSIGVILTGMGDDGAEGLLAMRKAGARTFGQDAATSTVYGMPKVAFEMGAVEVQLPLKDIGAAILRTASALRRTM